MVRRYFYLAGATLVVAVGGTLLLRPRPVAPAASTAAKPPIPATVERRKADANLVHAPEEAKKQYEAIIAKEARNPDPVVQDEVAAARLRLGFAVARTDGIASARAQFLQAAKTYRGTGEMSPDFGSLPDQAAYQAAVCLVAEHKEAEAKAEFLRFIKERPESPLIHAAFRRLVRMNGGEPTPESEKAFQGALAKQEKRGRFEMSVCGPKALEFLLHSPDLFPAAKGLRNKAPDYKALAKLCGTTDNGTSVDGMRRGLKSLGIDSFAYRLNREDFAKASMPAILLEQDHFVALLKVEDRTATVYDPLKGIQRSIELPPIDDPDFSVTTILFSQPEIALPPEQP